MPTVRHHFPGLIPFIDRAADEQKLFDGRLRAKAKGLEHVARVQAALGQACGAPAEHAPAVFEEAVRWRHSLAAALAGVEAACVDVAAGLGLDPPAFAGASEPGRAGTNGRPKAHQTAKG